MTDDVNLEDIKAADDQPSADPAGDKVPASSDELPSADVPENDAAIEGDAKPEVDGAY